jgi:hypothetical protein
MSDLDRQISLKVMGYEFQQNAPEGHFCDSVGKDQGWYKVPGDKGWTCLACFGWPEWSKDANLALGNGEPGTVVGELRKKNYNVEISFYRWRDRDCVEVVISYNERHPQYPKGRCRETGDEVVIVVEADLPCEAICKAALKAVEER